jgi:hypothetical protein
LCYEILALGYLVSKAPPLTTDQLQSPIYANWGIMLYEIPNDPTYTKCKIEDLCTYLGYPPNNKAGRSLFTFRSKTVSFRKDFTEKYGIPLGTFPVDATSPIVNRCARDFLESHKTLFPEDPVALGNEWPTYPDEKKK